ncbi:hypothetical protein V8C86DRAFT_196552 [Haematococcus lacustris]
MPGSAQLLLLLVALVQGGASQLGHFDTASSNLLTHAKDAYTELEVAAKSEGFLQFLFNTDCYTQALRTLNERCQSMGEEHRARLALAMARCFLQRSTGETAPPHCPASLSVPQCTRHLSERAFNVYTQFYANIHSVCLFIQNQEFLRQAEGLTAALAGAGRTALLSLDRISANLTQHTQALANMSTVVVSIRAGQQELAASVADGLEGVRAVAAQTSGLQLQLRSAVEMQERLSLQQQQSAAALQVLSEEEQARAAAAQEQWQAAEASAMKLELASARAESVQLQLLAASSELVGRAGSLQAALDAVLHYQQNSNRLLGLLLGSSWCWSDLAYHLAALAAVLLLGGAGQQAATLLPGLGPLGWGLPPLPLTSSSQPGSHLAHVHATAPWLSWAAAAGGGVPGAAGGSATATGAAASSPGRGWVGKAAGLAGRLMFGGWARGWGQVGAAQVSLAAQDFQSWGPAAAAAAGEGGSRGPLLLLLALGLAGERWAVGMGGVGVAASGVLAGPPRLSWVMAMARGGMSALLRLMSSLAGMASMMPPSPGSSGPSLPPPPSQTHEDGGMDLHGLDARWCVRGVTLVLALCLIWQRRRCQRMAQAVLQQHALACLAAQREAAQQLQLQYGQLHHQRWAGQPSKPQQGSPLPSPDTAPPPPPPGSCTAAAGAGRRVVDSPQTPARQLSFGPGNEGLEQQQQQQLWGQQQQQGSVASPASPSHMMQPGFWIGSAAATSDCPQTGAPLPMLHALHAMSHGHYSPASSPPSPHGLAQAQWQRLPSYPGADKLLLTPQPQPGPAPLQWSGFEQGSGAEHGQQLALSPVAQANGHSTMLQAMEGTQRPLKLLPPSCRQRLGAVAEGSGGEAGGVLGVAGATDTAADLTLHPLGGEALLPGQALGASSIGNAGGKKRGRATAVAADGEGGMAQVGCPDLVTRQDPVQHLGRSEEQAGQRGMAAKAARKK